MCTFCRIPSPNDLRHWQAINAIHEWVRRYDNTWISFHDLAVEMEKIFSEEEPREAGTQQPGSESRQG